MVLDEDVAEAATFGEVDPIDTWIRSLDRPEDINEVDANGMTALNLCVKGVGNHFDDEATERTLYIALAYRPWREPWSFPVTTCGECPDGDGVRTIQIHIDLVYDAITMMPEYRGRSFEELRLLDYQQGNQVRRVCADCGRSLARENYSNTQWIKKRVGDSRCKECIGDLSGLAPTLASLHFD